MAESTHEQIAAGIQQALASIHGDGGETYWYTYEVGRSVFLEDSDFDSSIENPLIVLYPGDETFAESESGDPVNGFGVAATAEFFARLAKHVGELEESPWKQEGGDDRWLIGSRMVQDFLKKLLSDLQLGSLVENVAKDEIVVDRRQHLPGWVTVEVRFVVQYTCLSGSM